MNTESRDESKTSSLDTLVEHCQNEAEIQDIPADLQLASHVAASQPVSFVILYFFFKSSLKISVSRNFQSEIWNSFQILGF